MSATKTIHQAILNVMTKVDYVQKERAADSKISYSLKTENGVLNAIRPAMVEEEIIMYPVAVDKIEHSQFEAGKYKNIWNRIVAVHTYRFMHAPSEAFIDVAVLGDGADMGDKGGNKSMTTSKKYALLETFLLATGDDPDEAASPIRQAEKQKVSDKKVSKYHHDVVIAIVEAGHAENEFNAKTMLERSNLPITVKSNVGVSWSKYYRAARDEDNNAQEAAKIANDKYTASKGVK